MARKSFLTKILKGLPSGCHVNGKTIYHQNFRNIVHGIFVEGTPYKATWYIWDFMFPFFRMHPFVHLSHSHRISTNGQASHGGDYFSGTDEEIATMTLQAVSWSGLVEDMVAGCSPVRFLQRCFPSGTRGSTPSGVFDMACAAALCGDLPLAVRSFNEAKAFALQQADYFGPKDYEALLTDIAVASQVLNDGTDAFQAHMDIISQAAASAHGFVSQRNP